MKKKYITPVVDEIRLDNDISLQLASTPPVNPRESASLQQSSYREINAIESDPYLYENW